MDRTHDKLSFGLPLSQTPAGTQIVVRSSIFMLLLSSAVVGLRAGS